MGKSINSSCFFSFAVRYALFSILQVNKFEFYPKMEVFSYILTGDEMFYDIFKMDLIDEVVYEVHGDFERRRSDTHVSLALDSIVNCGCAEEFSDESTEIHINVVLTSHLIQTFAQQNGKLFTGQFQNYLRKLICRLENRDPEVLKVNIDEYISNLFKQFKELKCFIDGSKSLDGMAAIFEKRPTDGVNTLVLMFFKCSQCA